VSVCICACQCVLQLQECVRIVSQRSNCEYTNWHTIRNKLAHTMIHDTQQIGTHDTQQIGTRYAHTMIGTHDDTRYATRYADDTRYATTQILVPHTHTQTTCTRTQTHRHAHPPIHIPTCTKHSLACTLSCPMRQTARGVDYPKTQC